MYMDAYNIVQFVSNISFIRIDLNVAENLYTYVYGCAHARVCDYVC